jgi:hypothetical protein
MQETLSWLDTLDVSLLRNYLFEKVDRPLVCVGSGGSISACHYATILYQDNCGIAIPVTPLAYHQMNLNRLMSYNQLFISASGNNGDILSALKKGLSNGNASTASLCTSENNKIDKLSEVFFDHKKFHYQMPNGKDGFLATNSLLAFFGILAKAFGETSTFHDIIVNEIAKQPYARRNLVTFAGIDNFVVIYGKYGEPIAVDMESKLSEAGLGATLISDYRNFGHGRHNWFDKKRSSSCLVVITTEEDIALANKTIKALPDNIPIIYLHSQFRGALASIDLLIRLFYLVNDLGLSRGIDPGRPGVPDYGSRLYHLNYQKLLKSCRPQDTIEENAVKSKAHVVNLRQLSIEHLNFYRERYSLFKNKLEGTQFGMVAFDFDGALSGNDSTSRYSNSLNPEVKSKLIELLDHGIKVAIISGRGDSIYQLMHNEIPEQYHALCFIGHYNGFIIYPLSQPRSLDYVKKCTLHESLQQLKELLLSYCPFIGNSDIDSRGSLLIIKQSTYSHVVAECCREIITSKCWHELHVWESSHSTDIVVHGDVDKRNIKLYLDDNILFIGDSGSLSGNDYQMLSELYSLSVDKVSFNPDSCWFLAPSNLKGYKATLFYLSCFLLNNGSFRVKINDEQ